MAARRSGSLAPWLGIALAVIVLDQLTKAMIVAAFRLGDARTVTQFFDIVRAHNRGAAFSFLNDASGWQRWFFIGLGIVAAGFIVWMLKRHGGQRVFGWALALILGGALGNVIDRLRFGQVVDFLDFHAGSWHWPAFNVADSAITVGAVLLILDGLRKHERRAGAPS